MYSTTVYDDKKVLFVDKDCKKVFVSHGKIVKPSSSGVAILQKDDKIAVCKLASHELHRQRLLQNRIVGSLNNCIFERKNKLQAFGIDKDIDYISTQDDENILASLDILEVI